MFINSKSLFSSAILAAATATVSASLRGHNEGAAAAAADAPSAFLDRSRQLIASMPQVQETMNGMAEQEGSKVTLVTEDDKERLRLLQTSDSSECPTELNALASCLSTMSGGTECLTCVTDDFQTIVSSTTLTCSGLEQGICQSLQDCNCATCTDEFEDYLHCSTHTATSGTCGVACEATTSSGGGGFDGFGGFGSASTSPGDDICVDPVSSLYKGLFSDVVTCVCVEADEDPTTDQAACVTTAGHIELFHYESGEFNSYMESPSAVSSSVDLIVLKSATTGTLGCAAMPAGIEDLQEEHICMTCTVCSAGGTGSSALVGVDFDCHGVSSGGCVPVFPQSIV